jgi:hypothetical protein
VSPSGRDERRRTKAVTCPDVRRSVFAVVGCQVPLQHRGLHATVAVRGNDVPGQLPLSLPGHRPAAHLGLAHRARRRLLEGASTTPVGSVRPCQLMSRPVGRTLRQVARVKRRIRSELVLRYQLSKKRKGAEVVDPTIMVPATAAPHHVLDQVRPAPDLTHALG